VINRPTSNGLATAIGAASTEPSRMAASKINGQTEGGGKAPVSERAQLVADLEATLVRLAQVTLAVERSVAA
jgi:hypothetical protein